MAQTQAPPGLSRLPPDATSLAVAHRLRQQQLAAQAATRIDRLWAFVATLGWPAVGGRVRVILQAAMREASRGAQDYTAAAARAYGAEPDPAGRVVEATFAATASDGRDLAGLLGYPAFEVSAFVSQGMPAVQAEAIGGRHLQRIVTTQVADAARVATGVAVANDRALKGYVRLLTLPSCSRCILLAGKWYRWNDGFPRHPQCDCVHVPAAEAGDVSSPREVYDSLSDADRRKAGWSGHDQHAIDDGADLNRVTNAHRELQKVTVAGRVVKTTGVRFKGQRRQIRLTPEAIYLEAQRLGWGRDETIRQLKRHGYIL
jgi:hypothetical protein